MMVRRGERRGHWRVVLVALMAISALAATGAAGAAQESTTVTFAFWGDPAEERAYERVIAEFEAANPDVEVRAVYTPGQGEFQTKLSTDFSAGNPPDVFLINYRRFGQYAARGALEPLESRLAASTVVQPEDFYEVPMEAFRYRGGELTCLPQNISSLVVYYNVDLFNRHGVPLPEAGWTWDDFVAAAKALTVDLNGDGAADQHGVGVEASFIRYAPFIWMNGGEVVDDIDNPTQLTLDTPEALAAIEWFVGLGVTNHNVVPTEAEVLAEDDETRFMRGSTAMLVQSRRVVPTLRENIRDFVWDVAPLPVHPTTGEAATVLHSDAFCMAAAAENKDAAWRFIEFALGPTGQTILAETGRTVPSLKAVAESPAFLGAGALGDLGGLAPPPANAQAFLDTIPEMRRVPNISTWIEVEDAFNTAFKRAFYVELDIPGAIDVVAFRAEDAFERAAEE
jgi:multiple sugar transport system substrate-binding protein